MDNHFLNPYLGVVLQREDGNYTAHPSNLNDDVVSAVLRLDVPIAFTMSSETTAALMEQISPDQKQLGDPRSGITLPIVDSIAEIAQGRVKLPRDCFICLCRREQFVLVWADTVEGILAQGSDVETWLVGLIWGGQVVAPESPNRSSFSRRASGRASQLGLSSPFAHDSDIPRVPSLPSGYQTPERKEKYDVIQTAIAREEEGDAAYDPERDGREAPKRPFLLTHAVMCGLAVILVIVVEFACISSE